MINPDGTTYPWISDYLDFVEIPNEGKKTRIIAVHSKRNGDLLGTIKWFGRWRQYTFWPETETIYNWSCLDHLGAVLVFLNAQQRT